MPAPRRHRPRYPDPAMLSPNCSVVPLMPSPPPVPPIPPNPRPGPPHTHALTHPHAHSLSHTPQRMRGLTHLMRLIFRFPPRLWTKTILNNPSQYPALQLLFPWIREHVRTLPPPVPHCYTVQLSPGCAITSSRPGWRSLPPQRFQQPCTAPTRGSSCHPSLSFSSGVIDTCRRPRAGEPCARGRPPHRHTEVQVRTPPRLMQH